MKKLEHAWEFNFNLLWDDHIHALNSFDENMKTGMKLFEHIGHVRSKGKTYTDFEQSSERLIN